MRQTPRDRPAKMVPRPHEPRDRRMCLAANGSRRLICSSNGVTRGNNEKEEHHRLQSGCPGQLGRRGWSGRIRGPTARCGEWPNGRAKTTRFEPRVGRPRRASVLRCPPDACGPSGARGPRRFQKAIGIARTENVMTTHIAGPPDRREEDRRDRRPDDAPAERRNDEVPANRSEPPRRSDRDEDEERKDRRGALSATERIA
jgi:hypothetical protein